jgi:TPR repeat protein
MQPIANNKIYSQLDLPELIDRAQKGDIEARYELGIQYFTGQKTPINYVDSFIWLKLASHGGNANATFALADLVHRLLEYQFIEQATFKYNKYSEYYLVNNNNGKYPSKFRVVVNGHEFNEAAIFNRTEIDNKSLVLVHDNPQVTEALLYLVPKGSVVTNKAFDDNTSYYGKVLLDKPLPIKKLMTSNINKLNDQIREKSKYYLHFIAIDQNQEKRDSLLIDFY